MLLRHHHVATTPACCYDTRSLQHHVATTPCRYDTMSLRQICSLSWEALRQGGRGNNENVCMTCVRWEYCHKRQNQVGVHPYSNAVGCLNCFEAKHSTSCWGLWSKVLHAYRNGQKLLLTPHQAALLEKTTDYKAMLCKFRPTSKVLICIVDARDCFGHLGFPGSHH